MMLEVNTGKSQTLCPSPRPVQGDLKAVLYEWWCSSMFIDLDCKSAQTEFLITLQEEASLEVRASDMPTIFHTSTNDASSMLLLSACSEVLLGQNDRIYFVCKATDGDLQARLLSCLYFCLSRGRNGLSCILTQSSALVLHKDTECCPLAQTNMLLTAFHLVANFIYFAELIACTEQGRDVGGNKWHEITQLEPTSMCIFTVHMRPNQGRRDCFNILFSPVTQIQMALNLRQSC